MKYRLLGQDLEVSELGLGCMPMASTGAAGAQVIYGAASHDEAIATIQRAIDLGVTFFDTSEVYGPYVNEQQIGEAIKGRRDGLVIATKVGYALIDGKVVPRIDCSPARARSACEGALRRLGVDQIDLFFLHRVDPAIPIEEQVGGMADLVREGKVRHIGLCEASATTLRRAHIEHPITALQSEYSLWERGLEADILPAARELGVGFVAYSPLGRGFLTGAAPALGALSPNDLRAMAPRFEAQNYAANLHIIATISAIAAHHAVSPARVALAWLLSRGADIVPIPGAKRRVTMEDSLAATDLVLSDQDLARLDEGAPAGCTQGERYGPAAMKLVRA